MRRRTQRKPPYSPSRIYLPPIRLLGPKASVAIRLITLLILIIFLIVALQLTLNYVLSVQRTQAEAQKALETVYSFYLNNTRDLQDTAASLAMSIADRKDVQQIFTARDRQGIVDLLTPLFNSLKAKYRVAHLYLHDSDGVVFVRIHDPNEFGDNVLYRATVQAALNNKTITSGIELEANRMGVRGVAPIFSQGILIGLVEIGLDFDDQHLADVKGLTNADFRLWVLNSIASPANYKTPEEAPVSPLPDLLYYNATGEFSSLWESTDFNNLLQTIQPEYKSSKDKNNKALGSLLVPLLGYQDRVLGVIEIYQSTEPFFQGLRNEQKLSILNGIGFGLGASLLIGFVAFFAVIRPLNHLTEVARRQLSGETGTRASVMTGDEFEHLGITLNTLADNVDAARQDLERQVHERTRELTLAGEIGRSLSTVRDLDELLKLSVNLIQTRFNLYYVQVYLADPTAQALTLRAGSGAVGAELLRRGHRLPVGQSSINGRAAAERQAVVVPNTQQNGAFIPNPLLPDTLSEISVPLVFGYRLLGVLDLHSDVAEALNLETVPAVEALAGQLAVAIENAMLYSRSQQDRQEIENQTRRLTREGWLSFLDAIQRSERIGYAYEHGNFTQVKERRLLQQGQGKLGVPIMVGGESIGGIQLERPPEATWTETEESLVHTVAEQIARQMENLRILSRAESFRAEAEAATRRLTREGWEQYSSKAGNKAFLYDLTEVRPLKDDERSVDQPIVLQTLKAREQTIGEIGIIGVEHLGIEEIEMVNTISERLAEHIESLRLTEQTQEALAETAALYKGSEQVVNARNVNELLTALASTTALGKLDQTHFYFFDTPWTDKMPDSMIRVASWSREGLPVDSREIRYALADNPFFTNLTQEQPFISVDFPKDVRISVAARSAFENRRLQSLYVFPVVAGREWIGIILGEGLTKIELQEAEIHQVEALIAQAGTVAQNLRLFDQTQRALSETEALYAIISKLNAGQDYKTILDAVADYTILSQADQTLVMCIFDRLLGYGHVPDWAFPIAFRSQEDLQIAERYPISAFEVEPNTLFTNVPVIMTDVESDPRLDRITRTLFKDVFRARSAIIVPLMLGNQSLGFILGSYSGKTQFLPTQIQRLSTVANQVAVAIQGLQLLRQTAARAKREQLILEISAQINRAVDTDSILRTAAEALGKALQKQAFVYLGGEALKSAQPQDSQPIKDRPS